jgi:hypothetical protein
VAPTAPAPTTVTFMIKTFYVCKRINFGGKGKHRSGCV